MERTKNHKLYKWGIVTVTVLFSIFIFYLNRLVPYLPGDDYIFQLKLPPTGVIGDQKINSFSNLLESQINLYINYHYRIVNHTLLQVLLLLPTWVFDFLNTVFILCLPLILLRDQEEKYTLGFYKKYLSVLLFIWIFHFDLGRCYFLTTGSLNYTWLLIPQLLYISELFRVDTKNANSKLLIFLAIVNFNSNENAQVILFLLTIYFAIQHRHKYLWIACLFLLCGGLFMLASPSINSRIAEQGFREGSLANHLTEYTKRSIYYYLRYLPVLVFLIACKLNPNLSRNRIYLLLIAIFISNAIMIFIPLFEPRSSIFGFFLFLMLIVYVVRNQAINNYFLISLIGLTIVLSTTRINSFIELNNRHKFNENLLLNHRDSPVAKLNNYCDKTKRSYLLCHEISENPNYIDNKVLAGFYNIGEVKYESQNLGLYKSIKDSITTNQTLNYDQSVLLTEGITLHIIKNKNDASLLIENKNSSENKFIVRGSQTKFAVHTFYDILPKAIRLFFLDYLESDILGEKNTIRKNGTVIHYHYIHNYTKYKYFLISAYSLSSHAPVGEIFQYKITQ